MTIYRFLKGINLSEKRKPTRRRKKTGVATIAIKYWKLMRKWVSSN